MNTPQYFTSRYGLWITTLFFALAFYGFGAGMMDSFAMYPSWRMVGANEFAAFHQVAGSRIQLVFVLPLLVMTIFLVLLFWHRPIAIPRQLLWVALICTIIPWVSSAFIQIPIQTKLDQGKDDALLAKLFITDWIRVAPFSIQITTVFIMLYISLKSIHNKTERTV